MLKKYYLKHKDDNYLSFYYDGETKNLSNIEVLKKFSFLPQNAHSLKNSEWYEYIFKLNLIPQNRQNYNNLFAKVSSIFDLYDHFKGFNLNNNLWICEVNSTLKWANKNQYNNFENKLETFMFDHRFFVSDISNFNSPDWFTCGETIKTWKKENNNLFLLKSPLQVANKILYDNYAEFFTSKLANILIKNSINYELIKINNLTYSKSANFTNTNNEFFSFGQLFLNSYSDREKLEEAIYLFYGKKNFEDMMVFDALTLNVDRHLGNFGLLYNDKSKKFKPAPLFDFNKSLVFDFPLYTEKSTQAQLIDYGKRQSCFYNSLDEQLFKFANPRHQKWVKIIEEYAKNLPKSNCDKKYLKFIKKILLLQANKLKNFLIAKQEKIDE
ncbi:hypothetical protein [Metamycoplasma equirhinis]|uniref:hypothetical protein n=1 Tax=Metamycoplasma equirhinis TaxID=92402 RepID=UPI00359346FC